MPIRTSDAYEGDGGVYAYRYHDQEHVNQSGHARLPVGVVPAAVLGVTGHPPWRPK
jgi:hypothetical protein